MRKGAGISALSRHTATTTSYAALSNTISTTQLQNLQSSLTSFRSTLQSFAIAHREDIKRDPAFRHQFQKMCAAIGVDPLSGSRKRLWVDIGYSDWAYEVALQIVDVCISTRERNGGMIALPELTRRVARLRGADVSTEDVLRSIDVLRPLHSGYTVFPAGGTIYIRSVPRELDMDISMLLVIAATYAGRLTIERIKRDTGWSDVRAATSLEDTVMREGLGWVDDQAENGERDVWLIAAVSFDDTPNSS